MCNFLQQKKLSSKINRITVTLFSMFVALFLIWVLLKVSGKYEADALLRTFFFEPFKDMNQIREILLIFAPFLVGALAVLICFRAGFINLNVSGQMAFSGLMVYIAGFFLKTFNPEINWLPVLVIVGILSALTLSLLIAFLRIYFGVNEVLSGIFLNYVVYYIFRAVVKHETFVDRLSQQQTNTDLGSMIGFNFIFAEVLSVSLFVSVLIFLFVAFFIKRSRFGFKLKMIGQFPTATKYAGINTNRQIVLLFCLSGILSGVAGLFYYYRDVETSLLFLGEALPANGFDTLTIVWLAQSSFVALPFMALFISLIRIQQTAFLINEVDAQVVEILIGSLILAVAFGNQLYVDPVLRKRIRGLIPQNKSKIGSQFRSQPVKQTVNNIPAPKIPEILPNKTVSVSKKTTKGRKRERK